MKQNALMATAGTHHQRDLMPEVGSLHVVINEPTRMRIDAFQVNALGFGGQNASLVVTRESGRAYELGTELLLPIGSNVLRPTLAARLIGQDFIMSVGEVRAPRERCC